MNNDIFWAAFQNEVEKIAATLPGKKPFVKGWSAPVKPEPSYMKGTTGPITIKSLAAEDAAKAKPAPSFVKGYSAPVSAKSGAGLKGAPIEDVQPSKKTAPTFEESLKKLRDIQSQFATVMPLRRKGT